MAAVIEDKYRDQALGYRRLDGFDALPLEGPGRWAEIYDGITLYTNDSNILFAHQSDSPATVSFCDLILAIRKAYKDGESTTQEFDRLRGEHPSVPGDLSEIA